MFNQLHSSANQQLLKQKEATTEFTLFSVSKGEWYLKGGYCTSLEECIVHTVISQKAPLGLKQHQTVKLHVIVVTQA